MPNNKKNPKSRIRSIEETNAELEKEFAQQDPKAEDLPPKRVIPMFLKHLCNRTKAGHKQKLKLNTNTRLSLFLYTLYFFEAYAHKCKCTSTMASPPSTK
jgi:hypothetical protein